MVGEYPPERAKCPMCDESLKEAPKDAPYSLRQEIEAINQTHLIWHLVQEIARKKKIMIKGVLGDKI